jgi:hypothetical protein
MNYKGYKIEVIGNAAVITGNGANVRLPYLNGMTDDERIELAKRVIDDTTSTWILSV